MEPRIQLGDKSIVVGQVVSARWLGQWYKGKVLKLGPKKNLFEVKESITGECILLEKEQLKPIDRDLPTHQQLDPGAEVAYYDNDIKNWISGTIQENHAVGMLYVQWSKFPESATNENWFSFDDTAPIVPKATSVTTDGDDPLKSRPSWIDILEENPRHVANEAFQDGLEYPHHRYSFSNKLPSPSQLAKTQDNSLIQPRRTSMSMKNHYVPVVPPTSKRKGRHRRKSLPGQVNHLYNHVAQQRGKLDHSEVAPVWSYLGQTKGIPPHPSSIFYRRMKQSMYLPAASSLQRTPGVLQGAQMRRAKSDVLPRVMSRSPTGLSSPTSELYHYAEMTLSPSSSGTQASVTNMTSQHRKLTRHASDMSQRPLPELPFSHLSSVYEVPLPSSHPSRTDIHAVLHNLPETEEQPGSSMYTEIESRAPHIQSSSPSLVSIELGGSTLLTCRASGEIPIKYEWERNGKKLTNNNARIAFPSPGTLQLYSITSDDAGIYKCSATNSRGSVSCVYNLRIRKGSPIKQLSLRDSSESSAEEGEQETVKAGEEELGNLRHDFMAQTPKYDDYPMDLSHPMPLIPTVIAESVQQQHGKKEKSRVGKKVEERKTKKNKRKRVSTVLSNDMDSYLGGYGADYGAEPTDSDLLALPSTEQHLSSSHETRDKPRKGFLSSILGVGNRLTTSKSALVLQEMVSSSKSDLETSRSASALINEQIRSPLLSKSTSDIQDKDDISSTQSGVANDKGGDREVVVRRRQVEFSPVRDIVIHPTFENGFDQLTHTSEDNSDTNVEAFLDSPRYVERRGAIFTFDTQDGTSPLQPTVEEVNNVDDDEGSCNAVELMKKPADFLPANSEDSMDAHPSRESLISDENSNASSDRDEHGKRDLPQETAHYTESVRRLQDAHSAYQEEHFGKKKTSKHKLGGWFKSKQSDTGKITMI